MKLQRARAFTQVELLTVIAIIGVLAAILIPVVGSARQAAKASQCTSNLRQLAQGYLVYLTDNRGEAPMDNDTAVAWPVALMRTVLGDTLANKIKQQGDTGNPTPYPTLSCPSADISPRNYFHSNYAINVNCLSRSVSSAGAAANRGGPGIIRPLLLAQNPSRILLTMDAPPSNAGGVRTIIPGMAWGETQFAEMFRHKGRTNAAYLDGSVADIGLAEAATRVPRMTYAKTLPWRDWDW